MSASLPGSPFTLRRHGSRGSQFSWPKKPRKGHGDRQPLVFPCLDNLDLPFADDSKAVTPTSDDILCNNSQNTHFFPGAPPGGGLGHHGSTVGRRRLSSTSFNSRMSQLESRFGSRRDSASSHHSRKSYSKSGHGGRGGNRAEPTHFFHGASVKHRPPAYPGVLHAAHPLLPEVIVDRTKSDDNVSTASKQP